MLASRRAPRWPRTLSAPPSWRCTMMSCGTCYSRGRWVLGHATARDTGLTWGTAPQLPAYPTPPHPRIPCHHHPEYHATITLHINNTMPCKGWPLPASQVHATCYSPAQRGVALLITSFPCMRSSPLCCIVVLGSLVSVLCCAAAAAATAAGFDQFAAGSWRGLPGDGGQRGGGRVCG